MSSRELAEEPLDQLGDGASIINVARCQAKSQRFTLLIDDQMPFKAVEPAHGRFATGGSPGEHPMLMDARVVAHRKSS